MKNKNKFRIDRIEIWTKLIFKTFITDEFNVFCLYFCFIFIFLSRNWKWRYLLDYYIIDNSLDV